MSSVTPLRQTPAVARSRASRGLGRARVGMLAAAAALLLGQIAPTVHAVWGGHTAPEHPCAEMSAECSLCELTAARPGDAAPPAVPGSTPSPSSFRLAGPLEPAPRVDLRKVGPNGPRAPPASA